MRTRKVNESAPTPVPKVRSDGIDLKQTFQYQPYKNDETLQSFSHFFLLWIKKTRKWLISLPVITLLIFLSGQSYKLYWPTMRNQARRQPRASAY